MKGGSHRPTSFGWINQSEDNGETAAEVGGIVVCLTAEVNLNVGDVVYGSAAVAGNVNKSAVAATTLDRIVGIVVGGDNTNMEVVQDDPLIGTLLAAAAGRRVLVAVSGIAKVLADAAIAGLNAKVIDSIIVAGRVAAGVTAGHVVGRNMNAAAGAASVVKVLIDLQ
jgi:hypothetical protein